jgi:hypothetical protein
MTNPDLTHYKLLVESTTDGLREVAEITDDAESVEIMAGFGWVPAKYATDLATLIAIDGQKQVAALASAMGTVHSYPPGAVVWAAASPEIPDLPTNGHAHEAEPNLIRLAETTDGPLVAGFRDVSNGHAIGTTADNYPQLCPEITRGARCRRLVGHNGDHVFFMLDADPVKADGVEKGKLISERAAELADKRLVEMRQGGHASLECDQRYRDAVYLRALIETLDERLGRK